MVTCVRRSNSSIGGHYHPARCTKVPSHRAEKVQGMNACKMTCSHRGTIWPSPTGGWEDQLTTTPGQVRLSQRLVNFLPQELRLVAVTAPSEQVIRNILQPSV